MKMKMLFMKWENSVTPIHFHFDELSGNIYPYTLVSDQEMKAVSYAEEMFSFNSRMMAKHSWLG